jgi:hypothetical protein
MQSDFGITHIGYLEGSQIKDDTVVMSPQAIADVLMRLDLDDQADIVNILTKNDRLVDTNYP